MKMAHHGKADWTDDDRVQQMVKSYPMRYDDMFWKSLDALIGSGTREVVADFGCGPGLLLADVANQYNAKVAIGLDKSKEMLAQAKTFLKERTNLDSFELIHVNFDTEEIPVETNSIDFAFSGFTLHEVASPTDFVSQVYRHIRLHGFYVVYEVISGNEDAFVKGMSYIGMSEEHARKLYPHVGKHTPSDIVEILQSSGFQDCRMITIDDFRAVVVGLKR